MNWFLRFMRFLAISAFKLIFRLIAIFARFIILPFLMTALRLSGRLVFTSLTATVTGPRHFTDRLASEWTRRLLELGISRDNIDQLYSLCHFLVVSQIVLGWGIAALITVGILRIVFELFI